ncbi:MAG: GNAT family N-acetyltransferase [Candidatus Lokiarchaeota archaeon]|nr:GNAT family N-acetyltransferase [Candidatus Lokiarchaeota archaeon]
MVFFRIANLNDLNDLITLRVEFLREIQYMNDDKLSAELMGKLRQYFERSISSGDFIAWIALDRDEIIGTSGICFLIHPPSNKNISGKEAYIMNMYTKPKWRKQGIGTVLLDKVIEEATKRRIKKIILDTTEAGKSIYVKRGFQFVDNAMYLEEK